MKTTSDYCLEIFGEKLYKISLDARFTCPNRDGTLGTRGCIFCSAGGSGDFAGNRSLPIAQQIEQEKARVAAKYRGDRYIAYFQAFTNTYAPVEKLEKLFTEVIERSDIAALSIATRPDCLSGETVELLERLNKIKPVWVELGLQTIHPASAEYIRRGYSLEVYDRAMEALDGKGIHRIVHLILGLPGETREDMLASLRYVINSGAEGIKLQLLHVLEGTDLAEDYRAGKFECMELEEYARLVADCVEIIPEDTVIHRLTGDGDKKILIAPLWSGDKKRVLNTVNSLIRQLSLTDIVRTRF
ncbi:MAG: TIGR01212 family radical SAM protein [Oscillospiraceae bacterium]|nr:TIGR01212 family radical SAM protein [Oscillospiraceae bacterium]